MLSPSKSVVYLKDRKPLNPAPRTGWDKICAMLSMTLIRYKLRENRCMDSAPRQRCFHLRLVMSGENIHQGNVHLSAQITIKARKSNIFTPREKANSNFKNIFPPNHVA